MLSYLTKTLTIKKLIYTTKMFKYLKLLINKIAYVINVEEFNIK